MSPASIAFSKRRLHRSNIQLIIPSGENGGYPSVYSVALDVTLCQRHQIHLQNQNLGYLVCPRWPLSTVTSRASKHQEVQSMLQWTYTECPSSRLTWLHTLEVGVWGGSRRLSKLEVANCDLNWKLLAVESAWKFCLGHLILQADYALCSKVQRGTSVIPTWQLRVDTSAGMIVPKTVLTCNIFSTTRFWSQSTLELKCFKGPTPRRDKTPRAADESKYKYMRMRTWSTQQRMVLMRMASMTAEAAAYVSDSALDSDTIFWVLDDEYTKHPP